MRCSDPEKLARSRGVMRNSSTVARWVARCDDVSGIVLETKCVRSCGVGHELLIATLVLSLLWYLVLPVSCSQADAAQLLLSILYDSKVCS